MVNMEDIEDLVFADENLKDDPKSSRGNVWEIYKKLERKRSHLDKVQKALETIANDLLRNESGNDIFDSDDTGSLQNGKSKSKSNNIVNLREDYRVSESNTKRLRDKLSGEISFLESKLMKEIEENVKIEKSEKLLKYRNGVLKKENVALQQSLEELKVILANVDEDINLKPENNTPPVGMYGVSINTLDSKKVPLIQCPSTYERSRNKRRPPPYTGLYRRKLMSENKIKNTNTNTNCHMVNQTEYSRQNTPNNYRKQGEISPEETTFDSETEEMDKLLTIFESFRNSSENCPCNPKGWTLDKPDRVYYPVYNADNSDFTKCGPTCSKTMKIKKGASRVDDHWLVDPAVACEEIIQEERRRTFTFAAIILLTIGLFISLYYRYSSSNY